MGQCKSATDIMMIHMRYSRKEETSKGQPNNKSKQHSTLTLMRDTEGNKKEARSYKQGKAT